MRGWTLAVTGLARALFWLRSKNMIKRRNTMTLITPRLYEQEEKVAVQREMAAV